MASPISFEQARQIVLSTVSAGPVVRVPLRAAVDRTLAEPLPWRGSGDLFGMIQANALLETTPRTPARDAGEEVLVLFLERP